MVDRLTAGTPSDDDTDTTQAPTQSSLSSGEGKRDHNRVGEEENNPSELDKEGQVITAPPPKSPPKSPSPPPPTTTKP